MTPSDQDDRENKRRCRQRGKILNLRLNGAGDTPETGPSPEPRSVSSAGELSDVVEILPWESLA